MCEPDRQSPSRPPPVALSRVFKTSPEVKPCFRLFWINKAKNYVNQTTYLTVVIFNCANQVPANTPSGWLHDVVAEVWLGVWSL